MEEKVFLGAQWGSFKGDDGRKISFRHVFFFERFPENDNPDYNTMGYRGNKYKLADVKLVKGLEPLTPVTVYFNSRGEVTQIDKSEDSSLVD